MIEIDIRENLHKYKSAIIVDLTTKCKMNIFNTLSPYYPHGGIPIPNTPNICLNSVSEVWQKLCVNKCGNLDNTEHENLIFKKGLYINEYWTYTEARRKIFIPLYCWMLENKAYNMVEYLREQSPLKRIVIIDNSINGNIDNVDKPLSSAFLLKAYIEGKEPYVNAIKEVTEHHYVMAGRKEIAFQKKKLIAQKIANIYTGSQRTLDL